MTTIDWTKAPVEATCHIIWTKSAVPVEDQQHWHEYRAGGFGVHYYECGADDQQYFDKGDLSDMIITERPKVELSMTEMVAEALDASYTYRKLKDTPAGDDIKHAIRELIHQGYSK